jgi:hypothetical protein
LPRLPPPSCARPVSGVGLGPSYYPASLLWSPGPRPSPVFRSAVCDCLSLNVSLSLFSPVPVRGRGGSAPGLGRGPPGRERGAGSSVSSCVRGPGGAGGGGLGGRWVVFFCGVLAKATFSRYEYRTASKACSVSAQVVCSRGAWLFGYPVCTRLFDTFSLSLTLTDASMSSGQWVYPSLL